MVATRKKVPVDPFKDAPLTPEQVEAMPAMLLQAKKLIHPGVRNEAVLAASQMPVLAKYLPLAVLAGNTEAESKIRSAIRIISKRPGWTEAWENFSKTGFVAGVSPAKALLRRRRE